MKKLGCPRGWPSFFKLTFGRLCSRLEKLKQVWLFARLFAKFTSLQVNDKGQNEAIILYKRKKGAEQVTVVQAPRHQCEVT